MHGRRFRECSAATCFTCTLGKKYEEVTARLAAGKAVPLHKVCPVPCLFPLVWKASSWGPHGRCHQTLLWSTLRSCLMPCQSPGFNYFILGCKKASPLRGKSVLRACLQQGLCWQGHPWWSSCPLWYRGQLLSIPAQLPTFHTTSDHHLVQRKTTCTSKSGSHLLLSPERGKLHPKSLCQQYWVQGSEVVRASKAGAQACAPQPAGNRHGTLLHRSQGGRGYTGCKCWSQGAYWHVQELRKPHCNK